jgi:hypothetical protein
MCDDLPEESAVLTATAESAEAIDESASARADQLRARISEIKSASEPEA